MRHWFLPTKRLDPTQASLLSRQNLNQPFIEERVKSGPKINNVQNTRVSTAQQHISYIPSQNNQTNYESFVSELLSNVKLINNINIKIFYCMILTKFSLVIRTKFILHSLTCFNSCTNMFFNFDFHGKHFYWYTHTYERHCLQSRPVDRNVVCSFVRQWPCWKWHEWPEWPKWPKWQDDRKLHRRLTVWYIFHFIITLIVCKRFNLHLTSFPVHSITFEYLHIYSIYISHVWYDI